MPFRLAILMSLAAATAAAAAGAPVRGDGGPRRIPAGEVRREPLPVESAMAGSVTAIRRAVPERARRN